MNAHFYQGRVVLLTISPHTSVSALSYAVLNLFIVRVELSRKKYCVIGTWATRCQVLAAGEEAPGPHPLASGW